MSETIRLASEMEGKPGGPIVETWCRDNERDPSTVAVKVKTRKNFYSYQARGYKRSFEFFDPKTWESLGRVTT